MGLDRRKSRYCRWAAGILAGTALLIGAVCYAGAGDEPAPAATTHIGDGWQAEWTIGPYPAKVLQESRFTVKLADADGRPIRSADVSAELDMRHMGCGTVSFRLKETAPGVYEGTGYALMPGTWEASLTVDAADRSFDVNRQFAAVR